MAQAAAVKKTMTIGEGGTAIALLALAILTIVIAAKAWTPAYAFHAYLFAAASLASVFAIFNRYFSRSAEPVPQEIDGKPNYNYGPIKFATRRFDGLGHRRLHGRPDRRAGAGLPGAELRSVLHQFRSPASAAHLGGDLRLRRQRAAGDVVLRGPAHQPRAARRRHRALVRGPGLQLLHPDRRHGLPARHHAGQGIRRAGVVRRPVADGRLGRRTCWSSWARCGSARSRTSTWRTGSTSPSS